MNSRPTIDSLLSPAKFRSRPRSGSRFGGADRSTQVFVNACCFVKAAAPRLELAQKVPPCHPWAMVPTCASLVTLRYNVGKESFRTFTVFTTTRLFEIRTPSSLAELHVRTATDVRRTIRPEPNQ